MSIIGYKIPMFLDASKAFDNVKHSKLFKLLLNRNICPLFIRIILNMYECGNSYIEWNGIKSDIFHVNNGVKQGGVLSPILFNLYTGPLLKDLRDSGVGCCIGNISANSFSYADDMVILSPTITGISKLINICEKYGKEYNIDFNPSKCKLLCFSNLKNYSNLNIKINGVKIAVEKDYKHLGNHVSTDNQNANIDHLIHDMNTRTNTILREFYMLNSMSRRTIFNSHCLHLYGCELIDVNNNKIKDLCIN